MTEPKLTDTQALAIAMVKDNPGQPVEYYANIYYEKPDNTENIYTAFGWLIFNQYLKLDERTNQLTTKGIV